MKKFFGVLVLGMVLLLAACGGADKVKEKEEAPLLKISAAVSLTDVLEEIKASYEEENNVELSFNLAGSGTLAQQIQQGAPVDVFISANQKWMDTLREEDSIIAETEESITGNNLVLIAHKDATFDLSDFKDISNADIGEIAIGNPESVPAGKYTEEVLTSINLWEEIQDKVVMAKDVRQVLTYVETGNADIGFVYESDALSSEQVEILATAEADQHEPIVYPGAVVASTKHEQAARNFVAFLLTEEVQDLFAKHGFKK